MPHRALLNYSIGISQTGFTSWIQPNSKSTSVPSAGISAIFGFVQLIWTWAVEQISSLTNVPWHNWPLWKLIVLVFVIGESSGRSTEQQATYGKPVKGNLERLPPRSACS